MSVTNVMVMVNGSTRLDMALPKVAVNAIFVMALASSQPL